MFKNLFKPKMVYGEVFVEVDGTIGDYYNKATILGFKCNSKNVRYCIDMKNSSTRWINDEHTVAVIGFEGDKKAWNAIKSIEFVLGTSEAV